MIFDKEKREEDHMTLFDVIEMGIVLVGCLAAAGLFYVFG